MALTVSCQKDGIEPEDDTQEIAYKNVLQVGRDKEFKTIKAASEVAKDSTLIEIDAGTYSGDVAGWTQNELYLRAVGGEVILDANGKDFDGMGIWKITGGKVKVEGITFKNAKVRDRNGVGIRMVKGDLTVVNCHFLYNEMGLLTGNAGGTLTIRNSEFAYSGYGDGLSHNLYVGYIDRLYVTGSYFHHAKIGHLLKSRAKLSIVTNCRLSDENDNASTASYEMDFPSGGVNVVVGNIIQQSKNTENTCILSFAMEQQDYYTDNFLYVSHNTIINKRTTQDPLVNLPKQGFNKHVVLYNNLLSENISFPTESLLQAEKGNKRIKQSDLNNDYAPSQTAFNELKNTIEPNLDNALPANLKAQGLSLIPTAEYKHPAQVIPLKAAPVIQGAIQTPF
jgi:hypothetical protein